MLEKHSINDLDDSGFIIVQPPISPNGSPTTFSPIGSPIPLEYSPIDLKQLALGPNGQFILNNGILLFKEPDEPEQHNDIEKDDSEGTTGVPMLESQCPPSPNQRFLVASQEESGDSQQRLEGNHEDKDREGDHLQVQLQEKKH